MPRLSSPERTTRLALASADALLALVAAAAATWIRFSDSYLPRAFQELTAHPWFVVYAIAALWALATTFDLYRPEMWRTGDQLLVRLVAFGVSFPVVLAMGIYGVPPWKFGRGLLALTVLLLLPMIGLLRLLWLAPFARRTPPAAVIIGNGPIVEELVEELNRRPSPPFVITDHIHTEGEAVASTLTIGRLTSADLVVVANVDHERSISRLAAMNFGGTPVVDAAGAYAALTGRIPVRQVDSRWFIATGDFAALVTSPFHQLQRLLDVAAACLLLVVSTPVLLVAGAAVAITGGFPILYKQRRIGRYRSEFVLFKLRTMQRSAEPDGPRFAKTNDSRVLPVGRWLRRWRIDEIPQLWNVIRGDMSLVGPRPERPEMAERMEREIPFYAFRYSVKPGLTGWAQVNLPYCEEPEDHVAKLEYDLFYLRHLGSPMYLMVLLRTLGALVFRPGQ